MAFSTERTGKEMMLNIMRLARIEYTRCEIMLGLPIYMMDLIYESMCGLLYYLSYE